MVGVFVAFIRVVYGRMIYMSLPRQAVIQLKYATQIIDEPMYKYGQQEQVTVRNHNRNTALEWSVLKYWCWCGVGVGGRGWVGVKPTLRDPNLALIFCYGSKHIVSCSVRVKSILCFRM